MEEIFKRLAAEIEAHSPFDVDGKAYPITLTKITEPPPTRLHYTIAFESQGDHETRRGELHVGRDRLDDPAFLAAAAVDTMRMIIRGELPPDTHQLL